MKYVVIALLVLSMLVMTVGCREDAAGSTETTAAPTEGMPTAAPTVESTVESTDGGAPTEEVTLPEATTAAPEVLEPGEDAPQDWDGFHPVG